MFRQRASFVIFAALLLVACDTAPTPTDPAEPDAGRDAEVGDDGGAADGGSSDDASTPVDAGPPLDCPGLREFTWGGLSYDSSAPGASTTIVPAEWAADLHYSPGASVRAGAEHAREPGTASLRAHIAPRIPIPPGSDYDANFRAEVARRPWHEVVPLGTELWFGFSYYLPSTYVQDPSSRATVFQLHAGRHHPPIEIAHWVPADFSGAYGTQLHVIRRWGGWDAGTFDRQTMPVSFEAGRWYDFVVHVVWDIEGGTRGKTEIWIDGVQLYSATGGNTYSAGTDDGDDMLPYGGTPKLGWYKWPWHDAPAVDASEAAGVTELEMYIGAVRFLRNPEGSHVGAIGYDCVAPRGPRPTGPTP